MYQYRRGNGDEDWKDYVVLNRMKMKGNDYIWFQCCLYSYVYKRNERK